MGTETAPTNNSSNCATNSPTQPLTGFHHHHHHKKDYDDNMSTSMCTSMTTESTAPSPCSSITNSNNALSSAESSPLSPFRSVQAQAEDGLRQPEQQRQQLVPKPFAMLPSLLGTPLRLNGLLSSNNTSHSEITSSSPDFQHHEEGDDYEGVNDSRSSHSSSGLAANQHDTRDAWSDTSSDRDDGHCYDQEEMVKTPVKRTTANSTPDSDWRIQALFREADCAPDRYQQQQQQQQQARNRAPTKKNARRFHRAESDVGRAERVRCPSPPGPLGLAPRNSSWTGAEPIQTSFFTRRNSRQNLEMDDSATGLSFGVPGQRRRNSVGTAFLSNMKKCRTSPIPSTYSQSHRHSSPMHTIPRFEDHNQNAPPASNSKTKNKMRNVSLLDLPAGVKLDDRLGNASPVNHNSNEPQSPSSGGTWKILSCRFRTTTFLFFMVVVGLASVGRNAMWAVRTLAPLTTQPREPMSEDSKALVPVSDHPVNKQQQQTTIMGGLRGSLLLSAVNRPEKQATSKQSVTSAVVKPTATAREATKVSKHHKGKDKKEKHHHARDNHAEKKQPSKHTADKAAKESTQAASSAVTVTEGLAGTRIFHPPPMHLEDGEGGISTSREFRAFKDQDPMMYAPEATKATSSPNKRVFMLHDPSPKQPASREVDQYPAEFTDNTQYYSMYDSGDERLRKMELREPYSQGECVPMEEWQTTFHPSCNGVHELGVEYLGEDGEDKFSLFGTKGYWRYAWRLDLGIGGKNHEKGDTVVLKTLKFRHDFEDAHFEHDRIDAVAMERLTGSPHVINAFGFCGHSVLTEYANGPRLGELADKSRSKALARLKIARDIANGLADVHGIDRKDGKNATFVHLDINPANVVSIGGTLKLNDFNIGIIRRWNTTSQTPCGFPAQYPNPQWRSPEEARGEDGLTEKVDVFSMGHIFFRLICGHEPWNKLEPGGKPSKEEINAKVRKGILPTIPDTVMKTNDDEVAAIRDAMLQCYSASPDKRPSAREIAQKLEAVLEKLTVGRVSTANK